jgi:hypothetical protein
MSPAAGIRRIMSISHAEFFRSIEPLARDYPYAIEPSRRRIHFKGDHAHIEIRLSPERRKQLGSLELPETTVDFCFAAAKQRDIDSFMARFDRCFHRGGG